MRQCDYGTHTGKSVKVWVGPRASMDGCAKSRPKPVFDLRTVQPVASRYTDWTIPSHPYIYIRISIYTCYISIPIWRQIYRVFQYVCRGFNNLPSRSPDATPCDFFVWSYVKDQVYVPPLPANITELKVRIRTANETITVDRLQTVWNEIDYRVDVCRTTKGTHIEHL